MLQCNTKRLWVSIGCIFAFALWTVAVLAVDVAPVGPLESSVGFSMMNMWIHELTDVHLMLYTVTDWLGLVPIAVCFGFAALGLVQWCSRKHLLKVDMDLLLLGVFYIVTFGCYLLFEMCIINYRPVLINGFLEPSYPSSTTLLVLCVMPTALIQLRARIRRTILRKIISALIVAFILFMVIGRLVSGVHWFTDIVGGVLLSAGLVGLYTALSER